MKAIADHFGIDDAPRKAVEAGCNLLIYRSESLEREAYNSLRIAIEEEKLAPDVVLKSVELAKNLKKELLSNYTLYRL